MNNNEKNNKKHEKLLLNNKIDFNEGKPFLIKVKDVKRYPIHFHENVTEILFLIKGTINVIASHENVIVKEGDFFFINNNLIHSLYSEDGATVAVFYIDLNYFEKKYKYIKNMYFRNNMFSKESGRIESDNYDYEKNYYKTMFKNKLIGILIDTIYNSELSEEISFLYENQLVDSMVNEFNWLQFLSSNDINTNLLDRYHRIVKYIQENINEKITIDEIIAIEHISKNYFSHFWKDISYFSFVERVNFEKVLKSEHILLTTDKNNVTIAEELSFSDVKYYYKYFKIWYGCTPLAHRNRCLDYMNLEMKHQDLSFEDIKKLLDNYLSHQSPSGFRSFDRRSEDSLALVKRLFSLDERYFFDNNMSVVLDLFNYIKIENEAIEINRYDIYQIILLTCAKKLGLTIKIDCTNINEQYFFRILNNFFQFSIFHFGITIVEKWHCYIKYNDSVKLDNINKITDIVKSKVENAIFKYYLEV